MSKRIIKGVCGDRTAMLLINGGETVARAKYEPVAERYIRLTMF